MVEPPSSKQNGIQSLSIEPRGVGYAVIACFHHLDEAQRYRDDLSRRADETSPASKTMSPEELREIADCSPERCHDALMWAAGEIERLKLAQGIRSGTSPVETCGNCDNKEPCLNQYGICSRNGGQPYHSIETPAPRNHYEKMFFSAIDSLAEISDALGIISEEYASTANGNEEILEAIRQLQDDRGTPVRASTAEVVLPNTAESTATPVHSSTPVPSTWICTTCKVENHDSYTACYLCKEARPSLKAVETDDLSPAYDAFMIGMGVRTPQTLLANIENAKRRSDCLSAIEREFFTWLVEDEEEGGEIERCPLSWGAEPDAYVEQFRAALATRAALKATGHSYTIPGPYAACTGCNSLPCVCEELLAAQKTSCVCGKPRALGVVHRTDGPCFQVPRNG